MGKDDCRVLPTASTPPSPATASSKTITATTGSRRSRFIVISGVDEMASIIQCIGLGAEDYLPKPLDPVLLHARLGASLDKKRMTDELQQLNEHLAERVDERVDEKVAEVERLNSLRRFVSPQLAEALAVGGDGILASHRREITAFLCDLRGFTVFSETAEPEEVMDVLREFHHAVGPMIFEHEGTIAQFTGDGLLVFFNDPVKLDDPAWNAVQLAVAMRDRSAELSTEWKRTRSAPSTDPISARGVPRSGTVRALIGGVTTR